MKTFTMRGGGFVCEYCGGDNPPLTGTVRDHCRVCLRSMHLDVNPGDRACECHGVMNPVGYYTGKKEQIAYQCDKCGYTHRNVVAVDDDYELILRVSANGQIY
ncbi:MAG: RNHCP domain-containing protein [Oscillospiraceae bacterium]|jgi:hypothetical protein|nr:RNHCP domain-containing protein [Oscillospiraceae bacterium]